MSESVVWLILSAAVLLAPIVFALMEGVKASFPKLPPEWRFFTSLALGAFLSLVINYSPGMPLDQVRFHLLVGIIAGLFASGYFDLQRWSQYVKSQMGARQQDSS